MKKTKCYENYPAGLVFVCNLFSLLIYGIGIYIISQIGWLWIILYLLFIIWCEYRVLKNSCINCCYYGKYCAFGKGKICALFFRKGNPKEFINKKITWKSIIPDFLVFLIPFIAGITLLIVDFRWSMLLIIILLFLLGFFGNALVRGKIACRFCKQREIGCPAEKLFNQKR